MTNTGVSVGLTLRREGGLGRLVGSWPAALLIAACTSWAAASRLRVRSNCKVTWVEPTALPEVIWVMPGISDSWRSKGVATLEAMVSGLEPGRAADTWMVGYSTCGKGATGSWK